MPDRFVREIDKTDTIHLEISVIVLGPVQDRVHRAISQWKNKYLQSVS
jgi:hypothetical protein